MLRNVKDGEKDQERETEWLRIELNAQREKGGVRG